MLPLLHLLGVGERDAVDALQTLGLAVALPVRSRILKKLIFTYLQSYEEYDLVQSSKNKQP